VRTGDLTVRRSRWCAALDDRAPLFTGAAWR